MFTIYTKAEYKQSFGQKSYGENEKQNVKNVLVTRWSYTVGKILYPTVRNTRMESVFSVDYVHTHR